MSFFGDDLKFNAFVGKDFLKNLAHDPKRLFLGVDPLSTKMWNGILGRKDKPLVDQLGGPYGGHTISAFGKQDGGVYKRAEDAGIDTGASRNMQDIAHVVASIYGGKGLMGIGGAGGAPAGSGGATGWGGPGTGGFNGAADFNMAGLGGGNAGQLAASGGIEGGAGVGSAAEAAPMGWQEYAKMMPQQQQQQQQQQTNEPNKVRIWTDPQTDYVQRDKQRLQAEALKRALLKYQRAV